MDTKTTVNVSGYRLPIVIEKVDGAYQATSSRLDGFLVLADTLDEVLSLAPGVARALIEAMQEKGMPAPLPVEELRLPARLEVLVPMPA